MPEAENQIEIATESEKTSVPMWVWGITAFVACYAVMQLQKFA